MAVVIVQAFYSTIQKVFMTNCENFSCFTMNENFTASINLEERSTEKEEFILHDESSDLDSTLKIHQLRWKNHMIFVMGNLTNLYEHGLYADCTVHAEGQSVRAHKVILAAVSPYFDSILKEEPQKNSFMLKDVQFQNLKSVLDFIYYGAVDVANDDLQSFMKVAELLQLKILYQSSHLQDTAELTVEKYSNHASCNKNKNRSATIRHGPDDVANTSLNETSLPVGSLSHGFAVQSSDFGSNKKRIESNGDVFANDNVIFAKMNSTSQIHESPSQDISELHKTDGVQLPVVQRPNAVESGLLHPSESPSSVKVGKYIIDFGDGNNDPFVTDRATNCGQTLADIHTVFETFKFSLDNSLENEVQNRLLPKNPEVPQFLSSNNLNTTLNRDLIRNSGIQLGNRETVCDVCGEHFSRTSELHGHLYYFHKRSSFSGFKNRPHHFQSISHRNLHPHSNSENQGTRTKKFFTCAVCKATCKTLYQLQKHGKIHKLFHCEVCRSIFGSEKKLKKHIITHSEFSCAECGKGFGNYTVLKDHVAVHHGNKTFICAVCGKTFGVLSNLDQHYLSHTEEEKVGKLVEGQKKKKKKAIKRRKKKKLYSCEKCKKKFVSLNAVKSHIDSVHQDTN